MLAAPPFNYLETLEKVDSAIDSNAELARAIVSKGLPSFLTPEELAATSEPQLPKQWSGCSKHTDIDKARSTLRQFFRDWSAAGKSERDACYSPVLRALKAERASRGTGAEQLKVLVPGAGLGRLVFDLCLNGFSAEGNEISYHQLLASSYILNEPSTDILLVGSAILLVVVASLWFCVFMIPQNTCAVIAAARDTHRDSFSDKPIMEEDEEMAHEDDVGLVMGRSVLHRAGGGEGTL